MKLIRLSTEDPNCVFDNVFNEDIIAKPNSRVCLQTFTTQLNKGELEINNQNSEIQFTLDGVEADSDNWFTVFLTNGIYDSSNISDLLVDITTKLNDAMNGATEATLGKEWVARLKGNRIEIVCIRGECLTFNNTAISSKYIRLKNATIQSLPGENYIMRTGGEDDTNDSFFYSIQPCNKGASSLRCQLRENPSETNTGFVIGYVDSVMTNKQTVNTGDFSYGIRYVYDDDAEVFRYEIIYSGAIIPADQMANNPVPFIEGTAEYGNDVLCIDIDNNTDVHFYIYRPNEDDIISLYIPDDYVDSANLFACGVCIGDTQVFNLQNTLSPYYSNPEKYIRYKKSPKTPKLSIDIPTGPYNSETYFSISSTELANDLGFKNNTFPVQNHLPAVDYFMTDNLDIIADYPFFLKVNSDSYIIELQDLKLDSYDSLTNQRRNILHVIPHDSTVVERVAYTASTYVWVDLNNATPINLRHIRARVLSEELQPIFVYGLSQIVMLLE